MSYHRKNGKYLHRRIVEEVLGRELKRTEIVHHVDGDKQNNGHSNLVVCPSQAYHTLLHARQRIQDMGGDPNTHKYCDYHKELHNKKEFSTKPSTYDGLHNCCRSATNEYRKKKGYGRGLGNFTWEKRLTQQYRRVFSGYTRRGICPLN